VVTPAEFSIILGAITALVVAVAGLIFQVRQTHALVNSRMTELVELTRKSAFARGKLEAGEEPHGLGAVPPGAVD
jgi:hypothetical protein